MEFDVSYATFKPEHFCYYCLEVERFEKGRVNDNTKIFMLEVKPTKLGKTREFKITYVFIEFLPKCKEVKLLVIVSLYILLSTVFIYETSLLANFFFTLYNM